MSGYTSTGTWLQSDFCASHQGFFFLFALFRRRDNRQACWTQRRTAARLLEPFLTTRGPALAPPPLDPYAKPLQMPPGFLEGDSGIRADLSMVCVRDFSTLCHAVISCSFFGSLAAEQMWPERVRLAVAMQCVPPQKRKGLICDFWMPRWATRSLHYCFDSHYLVCRWLGFALVPNQDWNSRYAHWNVNIAPIVQQVFCFVVMCSKIYYFVNAAGDWL